VENDKASSSVQKGSDYSDSDDDGTDYGDAMGSNYMAPGRKTFVSGKFESESKNKTA
jgi:hypothetical protein